MQIFPTLVFGNTFLGSIHGYKFEDLNGNGIEDAGDMRLAGVEITLEGDVDGDGDIDLVYGNDDQTITVSSLDPEARRPSADQATLKTKLVCPSRVWAGRPRSGSQTMMVPSNETEASRPSADQARLKA